MYFQLVKPHPQDRGLCVGSCCRMLVASPGLCGDWSAGDPFSQNHPKQQWVGYVITSATGDSACTWVCT